MKLFSKIAIGGVLLVALLSATPAWGQSSNTGVVLGTVVDSKGGVVPDVTVELVNAAINETKTVQTNGVGQYVFPAVSPGTYTLKMIKQGFATVTFTNITINVAKSYTYDSTLEVSAGKEVIEVTALRGLGLWNLDMRFGKSTPITERVKAEFAFDFFNIFNHPNFLDPSFDTTNPNAFGVINTQLIPADRISGSRWIQFGFRIDF